MDPLGARLHGAVDRLPHRRRSKKRQPAAPLVQPPLASVPRRRLRRRRLPRPGSPQRQQGRQMAGMASAMTLHAHGRCHCVRGATSCRYCRRRQSQARLPRPAACRAPRAQGYQARGPAIAWQHGGHLWLASVEQQKAAARGCCSCGRACGGRLAPAQRQFQHPARAKGSARAGLKSPARPRRRCSLHRMTLRKPCVGCFLSAARRPPLPPPGSRPAAPVLRGGRHG
jgi:hypothetical protein